MHHQPLLVVLLFALPYHAAAQQPGSIKPRLHLFADLRHQGTLAGPWQAGNLPHDGFCITVPLSNKLAALNVLPNKGENGQDLGERLARIRMEGVSAPLKIKCCDIAADQVRLYRRTVRGWEKVAEKVEHSYSVAVDSSGSVEVAVAVVLPEAPDDKTNWPRKFTVEVTSSSEVLRIPCHVAPFLIPSSLDPAEEVLIVEQRATQETLAVMKPLIAKLGLKLHSQVTQGPADMWMQDTIEPGQFAWPASKQPGQTTASLVGTRKAFRFGSGELDSQVSAMLRDRGIVTIIPGSPREKTNWIDWYGNLETSPPFVDRQQRRHAYGRLLTGKQHKLAMHPGVLRFLETQELQWPPIVVDTSWLLIGHVDEVVNFVPANNKAGFRVLLPSPQAARQMLDSLIAEGHGEKTVFADSRSAKSVAKLSGLARSKENLSIDVTLATIEKQLMTELNLEKVDFVHLPVVFDQGMAVIPNAVNSLIVNGHMLIPEPRGPKHQGKDLFEEAIRSTLKDCAVQVSFVDAWKGYHERAGELHCGTNTLRKLSDPAWWKHLEPVQAP